MGLWLFWISRLLWIYRNKKSRLVTITLAFVVYLVHLFYSKERKKVITELSVITIPQPNPYQHKLNIFQYWHSLFLKVVQRICQPVFCVFLPDFRFYNL